MRRRRSLPPRKSLRLLSSLASLTLAQPERAPEQLQCALHNESPHPQLRMLVHLRHPNVVTVYGAVAALPEPVLVMELFENGTLFDLVRNVTLELTPRMRLAIARDVLNGMLFLHSRDVLHNDLKASNVLIDGQLRAKVSDFGLSALRTTAGQRVRLVALCMAPALPRWRGFAPLPALLMIAALGATRLAAVRI